MSSSFAEHLENRARQIVRSVPATESPVGAVEQEIALVLDHLDRLRFIHRELRAQLLRVECEVGTELLTIPPEAGRRGALKGQIVSLQSERARLSIVEDEKIRQLHGTLLTLLLRHGQLTQ